MAWKAQGLDWRHGSRWIVIGLLATLGLLGTYRERAGLNASPSPASKPPANTLPSDDWALTSLPRLPAWTAIPVDRKVFSATWLFGLAVRGYDFWKERSYLAELSRENMQFVFGAQQAGVAALPQIVVMLIGESSRYDRWSLNGYQRETNPLLKKETNLVSLSDVVTAVSATRLSVPILVSRKPATQSLQAGFSEQSFLTAFKEAGFRAW